MGGEAERMHPPIDSNCPFLLLLGDAHLNINIKTLQPFSKRDGQIGAGRPTQPPSFSSTSGGGHVRQTGAHIILSTIYKFEKLKTNL